MITIEFLRSFRIAGYALFDLLVSFIGIYVLAPSLSKLFLLAHLRISRRSWMYLTLPLGVIIHILVGNFTPMTKNFLDMSSNYILKIVTITLFILGIREIKITKK